MSVQVSFTNKHERYSMNVRVYLSHLWKEMYMYMYDIVASIKCQSTYIPCRSFARANS